MLFLIALLVLAVTAGICAVLVLLMAVMVAGLAALTGAARPIAAWAGPLLSRWPTVRAWRRSWGSRVLRPFPGDRHLADQPVTRPVVAATSDAG